MTLPHSCKRCAVAILLAVEACAPLPMVRATPAPDMAAMQGVLRGVAAQVRRCYRSPRVAQDGRQIVTRLRLFLTPAGAVEGRPTVIAQDGVTPANRLYAGRMAEAAIAAVLRCAPLGLPAGFAGGAPIEIDLTFSPLAVA